MMVCKDVLCNWFKNLNPRKRIEYMCGLLHMCLPLELRFVGTVLEDYGKKDYHTLRDAELKANNPSEIMKYRNLPDEYLRAKINVSLALLHSSNTACAQVIFDTIEGNIVGAVGVSSDSNVISDVLLILALAVHHPAFTFEQKRQLHDHMVRLDNQRRAIYRINEDDDELPLDLHEDASMLYSADKFPLRSAAICTPHPPLPIPQVQPCRVCIQNIEVKLPRKVGERKGVTEFVIQTTWSNGEVTEVTKKYKEIQEFHSKLIQLFPEEKPKKQNGKIPSLPSFHHVRNEDTSQEQCRLLNDFFRSLVAMPNHILECDHMMHFFKGLVIQAAHPPPPLPIMPYSSVVSLPDEDDATSMMSPFVKSPSGFRNASVICFAPLPNDAAGRMPRYPMYPPTHFYTVTGGAVSRFPSCPHQTPAHYLPTQPISTPPRSPISSITNSPNNSRAGSPLPSAAESFVSVTQLLRLLSLDKYSSILGNYTVEQLSLMSNEDMNKLGLPPDAQHILRSKLSQTTSSEKPVLINGIIDNSGFLPMSGMMPTGPSAVVWPAAYMSYAQAMPASPRSVFSAADSSPAPSDIVSPPTSPGPLLEQNILHHGESSEGSEDLDKDKAENIQEGGVVLSAKTTFVKLPTGNGGTFPTITSASSCISPPDENKLPLLSSLHPNHPPLIPMLHPLHPPHPSHMSTPNPAPSFLGPYIEPKTDIGPLGAAAPHNSNNNNSGYTSDPTPALPHRQPLLQTAGSVRAPFRQPQPQPAHMNMTGLLQGKHITIPAENLHSKPGSPIIHVPTYTASLGQGATPMPDAPTPQRMSIYMPYGRGQSTHIAAAPLPPGHQTQGIHPYPSLVTRSVSTTVVGSPAPMTVSSSHLVTGVTASHASVPVTTPASTSHRSPSHNGNNGTRDSGVESSGNGILGSNEPVLRTSPLQTGMGNVTNAPSPPVTGHVGCAVCAYMNQLPVSYYPPFQFWSPNGLVPQSSFTYSQGQPILTNGYAPESYSHNYIPYQQIPHAGQFHPMFYGNNIYPAMPPQNSPAVNIPAPAPVGATPAAPSSSSAVKQRSVGCYNCGSITHKPAECQENSMEAMSGHYHLNFNYKVAPPARSDSD